MALTSRFSGRWRNRTAASRFFYESGRFSFLKDQHEFNRLAGPRRFSFLPTA